MKIFRPWHIFFLTTFLSASAFAEPTMLTVQKKLKILGLYHGTIDGLLGSKTHAAIRRYQIQNHLIITGELNEETLRTLNISVIDQKAKSIH